MALNSLVDFDPYRTWLGIQDAERPLNAYQLLGLAQLESNQHRIRVAIERQLAAIEQCRSEADEETWQIIHRELQEAIETLSDPEKKAVADALIRRKRGGGVAAPPADLRTEGTAAAVVNCRHCERPNASNRRFCSSCGKPLWEKCPQCNAECSAEERFCGSCGTDIRGGLEQQNRKLQAQFDQALQLADLHQYESALSMLRALAAIDDSRFEHWATKALDQVKVVEQHRADHLSHAEQAVDKARKYMAAHSYENALAQIDGIPEPLRSEEAVEILQQATAARNELLTLSGRIRELIEQRRMWELLPKVERILTLKPNHAQAQQLAGQLRDHFVKLAKAKMAEHKYDEAAQALDQLPSSLRTDELEGFADKVSELRALVDEMRQAALADETLLAIASKLVKIAPTNQEATKLLAQLQQKLHGKRANPRIAAVNWATTGQRTVLGCPVDWLGHITAAQPASEEVGKRLAEQPGSMFVAYGLALEGLDEAAVEIDFMPQEKGGVLGKIGLSFGKAKAKKSWGLDLSDYGLKAVQLSRDEKTGAVRVEACEFILHSRPLTAPDAEIERADIVDRTLRDFLGRVDLTGAKVCVGIPGQRVLGRFFELPPMAAKKVDDAVQFEAKHQIPIPLEELCWDYDIMDSVDDKSADDQQRRVIVVAVRQSHVKERIATFKSAGINVDHIQSDCIAIHNAIHFEFFRDDSSRNPPHRTQPSATVNPTATGTQGSSAIAIIDVGTSSTNVVISSPGCTWFRSFGQAGDNFTSVILKQFKLTSEQAEVVKREPAKARRYYLFKEAVHPLFVQLTSEVERSLANYHKLYPDHKVGQVFGIGGGFRMHGLLRHLRNGK
jgi:type IV pilus assembly protein PilM